MILLLIAIITALGVSAHAQFCPYSAIRTFIPYSEISNPVLQYEKWSIKDACVIWKDGSFYVFFSAFYDDGGVCRSHVVEVSTPDFKRWSRPILSFSGKEEGFVGMCSPDVTMVGDTYYVTFNSWGYDPDSPNRLFYMASNDLVNWTPRVPLAHGLTAGVQVIDAAIACDSGRIYLIYQREDEKRPEIASAPSIDGPWDRIGDGRVRLLMPDGKENGLKHENFQFIKIDGKWRLLTSDYSPRTPVLYTMEGSGASPGDWSKWGNGAVIHPPAQDWNSNDRDNAAALIDWRDRDGWFYLLYAGKSKQRAEEFVGPGSKGKPWARGWNRLGLARSKDLVNWAAPASR